jgi:hypothetical protein
MSDITSTTSVPPNATSTSTSTSTSIPTPTSTTSVINSTSGSGNGMSVADWILSLATSAQRVDPFAIASPSTSTPTPSLSVAHGTLCACQSSIVHIGVVPSLSSGSTSMESLQRFRMSLTSSTTTSMLPLNMRFIVNDRSTITTTLDDRVTVRFEFDEKKGGSCSTPSPSPSASTTYGQGHGHGDDHTSVEVSLQLGSGVFIILNESLISKSVEALRRGPTPDVPSSLPAAVLLIKFASRMELKQSDIIAPSSSSTPAASPIANSGMGRTLSLSLPFDQSLEGSLGSSDDVHELGDGNGISITLIPLDHRNLTPDFVDRLYLQLSGKLASTSSPSSASHEPYPFTVDRPGFGPLTPAGSTPSGAAGSSSHLLSPPRGHVRNPSTPRTASFISGSSTPSSSNGMTGGGGLSSISGDGSDDDDDNPSGNTGISASSGPTIVNGESLHDMIAAMASACPNGLMIKLLRASNEARVIDEKDGLIDGDRRRIEAMAEIFDHRSRNATTCTCEGSQLLAAVAAATQAPTGSSSGSGNELKVPGTAPRARLSIQLAASPPSEGIDKNQCSIYALKALIANGGRNMLLSILDRCVAFVTGTTSSQSHELESPNLPKTSTTMTTSTSSSSISGVSSPTPSSSPPPNKFRASNSNNDNANSNDDGDDVLEGDARDRAIKSCAPFEGSLVRLLWTLTELCRHPKLLSSSCTGKLRERFLETSIHKADVVATVTLTNFISLSFHCIMILMLIMAKSMYCCCRCCNNRVPCY